MIYKVPSNPKKLSAPERVISHLPTLHTDQKSIRVHSTVLKGLQAFSWRNVRVVHIFLFAGENKHAFEELCFHVFQKLSHFFALKISSLSSSFCWKRNIEPQKMQK